MGGTSKGGSSDPSGMIAALTSAKAADQEYQLGLAQLDWTKQVWQQEQPLINQSEQLQIQASEADIAAQQQEQQFAQEQEQLYNQYFMPIEKQYAGQAQTWASPQNMALYMGQAQSNVAEQMGNELNTAKEQLAAYGVNPDAPRYAGLYIGQNALSGAAQAGAGTSTAQNLRLQQMQLEGNALNIGQGLGSQAAALSQAGTGAGSAGAGAASGSAATGQANLSTGSQAMTNPTAWYNSAANNMGVYTGAVGQYNQSQANFAAANAAQSAGFGAAAGGLAGDIFGAAGKAGSFAALFARKGGPITRFEGGGGIPQPRTMMYDDGGDTYADAQMLNVQGNDQAPPPPPPNQPPPDQPPPQASPQMGIPSGGTPGGGVPAGSSPSMGQVTDDVPAQLTAGEFVIPKDVAQQKGHEFFTKLIDQTRKAQQQTAARDDIGGEPVQGIPQMPPRFVSRPMATGSTGVGRLPMQGLSGIPPQQQQQYS